MEILLGILDWRAGGRNGLCSQMKWNENEASVGRVLAVEVCFVTCITRSIVDLVQSKSGLFNLCT